MSDSPELTALSERGWWLRRLICKLRGHVPDGVVRGGDDFGGGGEMWCARRCGYAMRTPRSQARTKGEATKHE